MIDYESMRETVVVGLTDYLDCPVIRANQNAEMPDFPFVAYSITTLMSENRGTYGEYSDGSAAKGVTQTWSISAYSDNNSESVAIANKAREWLDFVGTTEMNDSNVICESVGSVTNRDNVITSEYEYINGFDAVFWLMDIIPTNTQTGEIDTVTISETEITGESYEKMLARLQRRLDGMNE